jgi:hypothetical protein
MPAGDGRASKFQRALTAEVEAWREKELTAKIMALQGHDRPHTPVLPCRAQGLEVFGGMGQEAEQADRGLPPPSGGGGGG